VGKNLEVSLLLDFYGEMLTDKQRQVTDLYYNEDLSLAEIAEESDITRQGVRDSIKRAEAQLFMLEEKLGLAKRFREMQEGLQMVLQAARSISEINLRHAYNREIEDKTRVIIETADRLCE
jgi:predicted DNA-binding protein YlxM (UPF0122 family)